MANPLDSMSDQRLDEQAGQLEQDAQTDEGLGWDQSAAREFEQAGDGRTELGESRERSAERLKTGGNSAQAGDRYCDAAEAFLQAGQDYQNASRLRAKLGDQAAADALAQKARDAYLKAARLFERCAGFMIERGQLGRELALLFIRTIECYRKGGDLAGATRVEDVRRQIIILKWLFPLHCGENRYVDFEYGTGGGFTRGAAEVVARIAAERNARKGAEFIKSVLKDCPEECRKRTVVDNTPTRTEVIAEGEKKPTERVISLFGLKLSWWTATALSFYDLTIKCEPPG